MNTPGASDAEAFVESSGIAKPYANILRDSILLHSMERNIPLDAVHIQERSIGINCRVFMITIGGQSAHTSRFVLKCFGEIFKMDEETARDVLTRLFQYQDQLNRFGVVFPYATHKDHIRLHDIGDRWILVSEEQYFGEGANHLDVLDRQEVSADEQERMILTDLETIILLQSNKTKTILGSERVLLGTGIDAKPDNFVTHGQSSVCIDLYPPLPMEGESLWTHPTLLHPTHPISAEGWFFFVATLEGAVLRYLNSGEFKLGSKKENIRKHYPAVLDFLEPLVPRQAFDTIRSQISERNFEIINRIYASS